MNYYQLFLLRGGAEIQRQHLRCTIDPQAPGPAGDAVSQQLEEDDWLVLQTRCERTPVTTML